METLVLNSKSEVQVGLFPEDARKWRVGVPELSLQSDRHCLVSVLDIGTFAKFHFWLCFQMSKLWRRTSDAMSLPRIH